MRGRKSTNLSNILWYFLFYSDWRASFFSFLILFAFKDVEMQRYSKYPSCIILYFTDKTTRRLCKIITIQRRYDSRCASVPVNIYREGNLISEESIFRAMSHPVLWFIANEYVRARSILYEERRKKKKEIRGILPFSGSLIPTTMTPAVRELTWTRKFPFATYGKYFPKTRKASPNPRRVWYHRDRRKFCHRTQSPSHSIYSC